jgi:surface antigen
MWLAGASLAMMAAFSPAAAQTTHSHTTHTASAHGKTGRHVAASTTHGSTHRTPVRPRVASHNHHHYASSGHRSHKRIAAQYRHSGLQCVPYAREVSHIQLSGNAFLWWAQAAGRYARGNEPEVGSVLNFRSIGRMPLGHVAVVTAVLDPRTILVTQANWVRGSITNDVTVQDVSANNDWTDVKVELGDSSTMGAAYPTYGFIYNRPDTGMTIASSGSRNEVAEAPPARPLASQAPNRNLQ